MACDSSMTRGEMRIGIIKKITRLSNGALIGFAGDIDCRDGLKVITNSLSKSRLPTNKQLEKVARDTTFLVVLPDGQLYSITTGKECECVESGYHGHDAIGLGSNVALGAMDAGADAITACRIACDRVDGCAEPIYSEQLIVSKPKKGRE